MDFGIRFKELRNSRNLTQLQMAEILETSKSNISKYEAGSVEPNLYTLLKISRYFGVSVDYMLGNDNYSVDYANYQIDTSEFGLSFKEKLKTILREKNITPQGFIELTGFHPDVADAFLWGNKIPSLDELIKITGSLNVSANYLLDIPEPYSENTESFTTSLTEKEIKCIESFHLLNEDNQDIIIGDIKKYLKEQRYENSVAAEEPMRKAVGK